MQPPHIGDAPGLHSYKNIRISVSTTTTYEPASTASPALTSGRNTATQAPYMAQPDGRTVGRIGGQDGLADALEQLHFNTDFDISMTTPPPMAPSDVYRDVTKEFFELSEKLKVGELVKDPEFTLFQAVGALEIMDPKMDSGLLEPEYKSFDALKPRSPEEVIGIMDRLLCHEMAWHLGNGLAQTIFTSLYIDKLLSKPVRKLSDARFGENDGETLQEQLVTRLLRSYCLALIKCCGQVNDQIVREHIYEEEDFVTNTNGISMLSHVYKKDVLADADSTLDWFETQHAGLEKEVFNALKSRMALRREMLVAFFKEPEQYHVDRTSPWRRCLELANEVNKTQHLGRSVDEAWSTSVQRKLASQVPPRPIKDIPFEEAMATLKQLCQEMADIPKILEFESASNTMNYFIHFIARTPSPLAYTRSFIQSLLAGNTAHGGHSTILGQLSIHSLILSDFSELCAPPSALISPDLRAEAPHSPRFNINKRMSWFLDRASVWYLNLFRTLCQNRSRLRRTLCHTILDWDTLQVECEDADTILQELLGETPMTPPDGGDPTYSFPLSSWVYHYKLRQMEWIMFLGFELDIYQPPEYAGMYWYLQHYLRTRIGHLERIRSFAQHRECRTGEEESRHKTLSWLTYLMLQASAMMDLSTACIYFYTALKRLLLIKPQSEEFTTEALRYELRMKPFLSIGCPDLVPFEIFEEVVDPPDTTTGDLLELANESVDEAKANFGRILKLSPGVARTKHCEEDGRGEVKALLKSTFGMGVAVGVVAREMEAQGVKGEIEGLKGVRIGWEGGRGKGYHPSFVVPEIVVERKE